MAYKITNVIEEDLIKDYRENLSIHFMAKKYSISTDRIYKILKTHKITKRHSYNVKNKFNYHYFDVIDTPDKAYFLGWLYSDGNNYMVSNTVTIALHKCDKAILETLASYFASNYPIKQYKSRSTVILRFNNRHTSETLLDKGLLPKKSLILKFPSKNQVPENLHSHFIRGVFDGDGSINTDKKNTYRFCITGTLDIVSSIQEILINNLFLNKTKIGKGRNCYSVVYHGNKQVKKIYDWLYKDCNDLYLKRKKEKFETLVSYGDAKTILCK